VYLELLSPIHQKPLRVRKAIKSQQEESASITSTATAQWEATALVVNDQVKEVITRGSQGRPFAKSHIDSSGFGIAALIFVACLGSSTDFWIRDHTCHQRQGFTNFGSSKK
jgi:hypothetical protein